LRIAADFASFVDDVRQTGPSKKECWQAARRVGSMLNYLGIQDASRKRRDSSQDPGAWSGSVVKTDGEGVYVLASEDKWMKAKGMLDEMMTSLEASKGELCRKRLEQIRGFLIYVTRTYPGMIPYLIGIHMTIDGWRNTRDATGWRLPASFLRDRRATELEEEVGPSLDEEPSEVVWAVPRLKKDIHALRRLMRGDKPRVRRYQCTSSAMVTYGFGDAPG
jgi:hypothetical protein